MQQTGPSPCAADTAADTNAGLQVSYRLINAQNRTDRVSSLVVVSTSKANRVEYVTLPRVTEVESSCLFYFRMKKVFHVDRNVRRGVETVSRGKHF